MTTPPDEYRLCYVDASYRDFSLSPTQIDRYRERVTPLVAKEFPAYGGAALRARALLSLFFHFMTLWGRENATDTVSETMLRMMGKLTNFQMLEIIAELDISAIPFKAIYKAALREVGR